MNVTNVSSFVNYFSRQFVCRLGDVPRIPAALAVIGATVVVAGALKCLKGRAVPAAPILTPTLTGEESFLHTLATTSSLTTVAQNYTTTFLPPHVQLEISAPTDLDPSQIDAKKVGRVLVAMRQAGGQRRANDLLKVSVLKIPKAQSLQKLVASLPKNVQVTLPASIQMADELQKDEYVILSDGICGYQSSQNPPKLFHLISLILFHWERGKVLLENSWTKFAEGGRDSRELTVGVKRNQAGIEIQFKKLFDVLHQSGSIYMADVANSP